MTTNNPTTANTNNTAIDTRKTVSLDYDFRKLENPSYSQNKILARGIEELKKVNRREYITQKEQAEYVDAINDLMEYANNISLTSKEKIDNLLDKKTKNHELPKHAYKQYGIVYDLLTSKDLKLSDGVYDAITGKRISEVKGYIVGAAPIDPSQVDRATFAKLLSCTQDSAATYEQDMSGRQLGNIVKIVVKDGKPYAAVTVRTFSNALRLMIENNQPSMYDATTDTTINNPYYKGPTK